MFCRCRNVEFSPPVATPATATTGQVNKLRGGAGACGRPRALQSVLAGGG